MDITFIENGCFVLKFFHTINRDRVLESGLWAFEKNLIVLTKVAENENSAEVDLTWSAFHVRILGLPIGKMASDIARLIAGKIAGYLTWIIAFPSKRALFTALKDRIWKRIHGWHEKTLSQAVKTVLIQEVVQVIPSYAISCFRLSKTLLQKFQALVANFFWHDGEKRKLHWLAWDQMCSSKLDGALGFRNLEAFNLALLGKQLWRPSATRELG
ncbi:UNVERIFIED_CONTAM: hypothetical protein Scaly_0830000 [Sesamum calycinum]|uniref:Reverse transcriptase n=1 Tax=Sesamum calycinum TaxID=2727403 RepID=A0AAW2RAR9_9LAMI